MCYLEERGLTSIFLNKSLLSTFPVGRFLLRCNLAISTFHTYRNYLLDSIWEIMINRIAVYMYYTPSCNVATQQHEKGQKQVLRNK